MKRHFQESMMAKRKGKSGSSGGGHPKEITEQQHDEAMNVLRAEYYQGVRSIAADIDNQKFTSQDDYEQAIHEAVDDSYWVIYTHANFQVLLCSDNHDAYSEEYGEPPVSGSDINWAALAFAALDKDVRQTVSEPSFDEVEETSRPRHNNAKWDYEGYWNTVLGANRSAEDVIREFDLSTNDKRGLDEWLGYAEVEAWRVGGHGPMPKEWSAFHDRALNELIRGGAEEAPRRQVKARRAGRPPSRRRR